MSLFLQSDSYYMKSGLGSQAPNMKKQAKFFKDLLQEGTEKGQLHGEVPVSISIIVPTYNCSQSIGPTLESIQLQNYSPLEVLIIDAGSTDRTLEVVGNFSRLVTRIYTAASFNIADMVNRGISIASGSYVSVFLPGGVYIGNAVLKKFLENIYSFNFPDLLYSGSLLWEIMKEPRLMQSPFKIKTLQKGVQPAFLPACLFKKEIFEKVGKFSPKYRERYSFEFFCRLLEESTPQIVKIDRVFIDFDCGRISYKRLLRDWAETWSIMSNYYGFFKALAWFATGVNHLLIVKGLWGHFKALIFKK